MPHVDAPDFATAGEPIPWQSRPLLPVATAATLLGRSRAGVYQLASEGRMQLVKLGGRTLARTADVIALVESATPFVPNVAPRGRAKQLRDRAA